MKPPDGSTAHRHVHLDFVDQSRDFFKPRAVTLELLI